MGYDINWFAEAGDPVLQSPQYQLYSQTSFELLDINQVKASLRTALASNESASVVNYLSWVIRVLGLIA